jgi:hypothetical protein
MNNGTTNGEAITPEEFDAMTDASDKPARAARARAGARAKVPGDTTTTEATPPIVITPEQAQAAREEMYERSATPAPLRVIFNKLPPEDIVLVMAWFEHTYRSGIATGAATGQCGHEAAMAKYNDVIAQLLEGVSLLDQRNPNVEGCLQLADAAHKRLTGP